ncbi:MAG: sugar MFS transporter [Bacteroidales bacterium]|nr:sugar MFS transporter [Bacteroidales bacterium]
MNKSQSYRPAFILITVLFFMWGFITCMNDILIPYLKKIFELNYAQAMLVQFAFFGAYFIGSLIYFIISAIFGDPIQKLGYRTGIIIGLVLSGIACLLFYPAALAHQYSFFLSALFILGLGFTMLQIAANPYVAILGSPETASSRLNLSQGFNSFGTTIAPIIGGYLVFHLFAAYGSPLLNATGDPILTDGGMTMSAAGVQIPYFIFAAVFFLLAIVFMFAKLPSMRQSDTNVKGMQALRYSQLSLGIVAIFFYVGSEVSVGSTIINYLHELVAYPEMEAKLFLAFFWGGSMIGRFIGAISLGKFSNKVKQYLLMVLIALIGFVVIYGAAYIESGLELTRVWPFFILIAINLIGFFIGRNLPARTLMVFCVGVIALLITTVMTSGQVALWAIVGVGLFNSIMWSNIFTLAINGLGKYTSQGSSLLIMAILGGALIPLLQGFVADKTGLQTSYLILIVPYLYLAFYGWKGHKATKKNIIVQ